jgi:hypothetical protein
VSFGKLSKEIKKKIGSKRIRLPRATQSCEAPPPPYRGCWKVKKKGELSKEKKKKVDSPKKEKKKKRESEGTSAHAHCIKASFLFHIFLVSR